MVWLFPRRTSLLPNGVVAEIKPTSGQTSAGVVPCVNLGREGTLKGLVNGTSFGPYYYFSSYFRLALPPRNARPTQHETPE